MCYDEPRTPPRKPVVVAAALLLRGDALGNEAAHVILDLARKAKESTNYRNDGDDPAGT